MKNRERNASYGITTSTDIRDKIVAEGRTPASSHVRQIMSGPAITARAARGLMDCTRVMQQHRIRHLPQSDEHDILVGLISSTDKFLAVDETGSERHRGSGNTP